MKKKLAIVLALGLTLGLAACGGKKEEAAADTKAESTTETKETEEETTEEETTEEETAEEETVAEGTVNTKDVIHVGFVQLLDMKDSDNCYEGLVDTIEAAGLSDKIIIDRQSASGDAGTMSTIIQGFVDSDYDLIIPILTPPAQAAVSICGGETPIIFCSVVDPVYSKIMPDKDTVDPANLATGTSNTIPADLLINTANDITPIEDGQEVAIFYNTSQNNAECTMQNAKAYCDENSIPYTIYGYADVTEAVTQAQGLDASKTAYVYVTLDSVIAASFNQFGAAVEELKIPCYAVADAMVTGGAFLSYGVDYVVVGEMTANMVIDWYNGTPLESMPCQTYSDFQLVVNEGVMNNLGITLPEDYEKIATFVETKAAN